MRYRALTIQQPWAWSIAQGHKRVENRSWTVNYRGPVAVHASANRQRLKDLRTRLGDDFDENMFPCAAVVGIAELVDVQPMSPALESDPDAVGEYCWLFANARPLTAPVKAKGKTSLFYLSEEESTAVATALSAARLDKPHETAAIADATRDLPTDVAFLRAETYSRAGRHEDAVRCCNVVVQHERNHIGAWQYMAHSLMSLRRFKEALTSIEQAFRLDKEQAASYWIRAQIWAGLDEPTKAKHDHNCALELSPEIVLAPSEQVKS